MKHLPFLLIFFLLGCGPLSNLQKLEHPNYTISSPKKEQPASVYFPEVIPISKPYVKGPILTEIFMKHDLEVWADKLGNMAAEKSFDAVIVIDQMTGSYPPNTESAVRETYIMITYMGVWYAEEELFPTNLMKSVRYSSHTLEGQVHVATAYFGLNGRLLDVEGNRDEYEWFQFWQGWYFTGHTHDHWYQSKATYLQNLRVDKSNPQGAIIFDKLPYALIGEQIKKNVLRIHDRSSNNISYLSLQMLDSGPQAEYFQDKKTVYKSEFGVDGMGRIESQEIFTINQGEVLVASAEYEYYRFEDLPEDLIVHPAKTGN